MRGEKSRTTVANAAVACRVRELHTSRKIRERTESRNNNKNSNPLASPKGRHHQPSPATVGGCSGWRVRSRAGARGSGPGSPGHALTVRLGAHQQRHPLQPLHVAGGDVPGAPVVPLPILVERVDLNPPAGVRHRAAPGPLRLRGGDGARAAWSKRGHRAAQGHRGAFNAPLPMASQRRRAPARASLAPLRLSSYHSAAAILKPGSGRLSLPPRPGTGSPRRGYGGRPLPPRRRRDGGHRAGPQGRGHERSLTAPRREQGGGNKMAPALTHRGCWRITAL